MVMKKTAAMMLCLAVALSLCGCYDIYDSSESAPVPKYGVCVDLSRTESDEVWDASADELIFTQSICRPEVIAAGSRNAAEAMNRDISYQMRLFEEGAAAVKNAALSYADENARPNGDRSGGSGGEGKLPTYVYKMSAVLTRGDTGVVSLCYDVMTYSGGVHSYVFRTGVSYDARTGDKLTIESISEDAELLNQLVYGYLLNISAGEKYRNPDGSSIFFDADLTEPLRELIQSDNWYFSEEGLVFYANPYELAPYSYGRIGFVVPYAAMDGLLKEEYFPYEPDGENGMMLANSGSAAEASGFELQGRIVLDEEGESIVISSEDTVYGVTLLSVGGEETPLWYRSYMTTGEGVELVSSVPENGAKVLLRYTLADGTLIERVILKNSSDGSVILAEAETD